MNVHLLLLALLSLPVVSVAMVTVAPSLSSLLVDLPLPHPDLGLFVSRQLIGAGFHRTLLTQVVRVASKSSPEMMGSRLTELCIALVENVTHNMYVDVDQVAFLAEFGGPELISSAHMDTEKPATLSLDHVVMTFTNTEGRVELPLHFRYQPPSPSHESPYTTVTIPTPIAFIMTDQLPHPLKQHHSSSIRLPCKASSPAPHREGALCSWTRAQLYNVDRNSESLELHAEIPHGLEGDRGLVVGVTILTTLSAMVYVAYKFTKVKDRTGNSRKDK